jgi:hypothetical protein
LNWGIALLVVRDYLFAVLWTAFFVYCAKYLIRNFKGKETESEKLVRESNEFMCGLRE